MEYYPFRPAWLRRWHPGPGVVLAGTAAREYLRWREYAETEDGVAVSPAALSRTAGVCRLAPLPARRRCRRGRPSSAATASTSGPWSTGSPPEELRHRRWPLRLAPTELDRFVAGAGVTCTHFDAFRFFTAPARPLNRLQPTRENAPAQEQRGCLHANMDLYKWAFKLAPFTASELIADCFALARDIREVDMRASPYDFSNGMTRLRRPIGPIEWHQRNFSGGPGRVTSCPIDCWRDQVAAEGEPLRDGLIKLCGRLLNNLP